MRTHAGSTKTGAGAQAHGQVARGWAQRAGGRGGWGRCGRAGRCGRRQEHHAEYGGRKCAECMRWKNYWSKCQRVCARKCPSRSTDCICNASTWYFVEPHENVALGAPVSARTRWQNDQYFLENTHSHQKRPGRPEGDQGSPEGNQRAGPSAARAARRLPGQGPDPRAAKSPGPRLRSEGRARAGCGRKGVRPHGTLRLARPARRAPPQPAGHPQAAVAQANAP